MAHHSVAQRAPSGGVAACVACHGPNAQGVGEIPRLGGLAYTYLQRRLEQWREGYHAAAGPPMPHIAGKLSPKQIAALASYLSFIKWTANRDGRKAGTVPDYDYSDANKNSGIVWDEATFREYVKDPRAKIPGTKMTFPGIKNEQEINDLWAYLKQFDADGNIKK
jgi:cytochrome c553